MAMITCSQCSKRFSSGLSSCPFCRHERSASELSKQSPLPKALMIAGIAVVAFAVFAIAVAGSNRKAGGDGAAKTVAPIASASPANADEAAKAKAAAKQASLQLFRQVVSIAHDCDAAGKALAEAVQSGDAVFAYRSAEATENTCLPVGSKMIEIDVPDSLNEADQKSASEALKACQAAYLAKWDAARQMKTVLDGDQRPSAVAKVQDATDMMQRGTLACIGTLTALAMSHGATGEDLGIKGEKK